MEDPFHLDVQFLEKKFFINFPTLSTNRKNNGFLTFTHTDEGKINIAKTF